MKNKILYLDTSEPQARLAIFETEREVARLQWEAGRELSLTLSLKYQELLQKTQVEQKDLVGIAVFVGPGSFTGLRIGLSFANGLVYGLGIPVYETKTRDKFDLNNPKEIALPFYGAPPKITQPKKK